MSRPHSLRCVFAAATPKTPLSAPASFFNLQRCNPSKCHLHSSPSLQSRPPPKYPNIKASDLGLTTPNTTAPATVPTEAEFPAYTPDELALLRKKYTPQQLTALLAGEASISPSDLLNQAAIRSDPMMVKYLDDFSTRREVIDHPLRAPEENHDPNWRFKTTDELADDMTDWVMKLPDSPSMKDYIDLTENRITVGRPESELNPPSYEAPEIPKLTDPLTRSAVKAAGDGSEDDAEKDPNMQRLMKQTGLNLKEIRKFRQKTLVQHRVVNQTRMGKVQSMYYLNVAGDGKGMVGIGEGKSTESEDARRQAEINAVRNMVPIRRYEGRTIFGDVKGKVGATELVLMTRPPGMFSSDPSLPGVGLEDMANNG